MVSFAKSEDAAVLGFDFEKAKLVGGKQNVCQNGLIRSEPGLGPALSVEIASLPECAAVDRSPSISLEEEGSGIAQHSPRHMLLQPPKDLHPLSF